MKQISHDITSLEAKIDSQFEVYGEPEDDTQVLEAIQTAIDEAAIMTTHVQYTRYLSHVYGRARCLNMQNLSREDLLAARKLHQKKQLEAYSDLKTLFLAMGGLLKDAGPSNS